jgi:D-lactate dehydrogenase, membrane binding
VFHQDYIVRKGHNTLELEHRMWTLLDVRGAQWAATMNKSKNEFGGRHFTAEVILWAVRWYLQFPISYRDLERMLADRGVSVDHTTVDAALRA